MKARVPARKPSKAVVRSIRRMRFWARASWPSMKASFLPADFSSTRVRRHGGFLFGQSMGPL